MITDKIGYGCRLSLIGIQVAEGDAIFLELTFAPNIGINCDCTRMCIATDLAWVRKHDALSRSASRMTPALAMVRSRAKTEGFFTIYAKLRQDFPVRDSIGPQGDAHGDRNQIKALHVIFEIPAPEIDRMHRCWKKSFINIISDCSSVRLGDANRFDDVLTSPAAANFVQVC